MVATFRTVLEDPHHEVQDGDKELSLSKNKKNASRGRVLAGLVMLFFVFAPLQIVISQSKLEQYKHGLSTDKEHSSTMAATASPVKSWNETQQQDSPFLPYRHHPTITKQPPFPRWGDANGIDFAAIQQYSVYNSKHPDTDKDLLNRKYFSVPTLFYVFGGHVDPSQPVQSSMFIWVANRRRRQAKPFLRTDRYAPLESLLQGAMRYLFQNPQTKSNRGWDRLRAIVLSTGVPMFVNLAGELIEVATKREHSSDLNPCR